MAESYSSKSSITADTAFGKDITLQGFPNVPTCTINPSKKKANPAQENKKVVIGGDASKDKGINDDHAGIVNPHYVLFKDYYGDIYEKYVGPYDVYIASSIWVPKTLVSNKIGSIEKWVPKSKN
jgi:hypothetical protein